MKKIIYSIMALMLISATVYAVPQYISYQGILRDITGNNLQNGTFTMQFKLYNTDTGGTAIYDSGSTQITVSNGLYNVRLGPVDGTTIFDGNDKWLEVTVGTDILSPRLRINSVAYALRADVAGTAASANYATLSGTASSAATADSVNGQVTATANFPNNALYINSGKIEISPVVGGGAPGSPVTGIIGTAVISDGNHSVTVYNSAVKTTSLIFISPIFTQNFSKSWLKIKNIDPAGGSFTVEFCVAIDTTAGDLPFNYLIIN